MAYNPTQDVNISFNSYVNSRRREQSAHMINGVPDYSFSMDNSLRQKMNSIPGMYSFFKALTNQIVPYQRQLNNMNCIAVGPNQYREIYEIGEECAKRLGIGVPQIYVQYDVHMNAYALASEDAAPVIIVTSEMVDKMTKGELKTVIGHECGHIHNNHSIYNIAANILTGTISIGLNTIPGLQQLVALLSMGAKYALLNWSRCAEITSDRAGFICADSLDDAINAEAKFRFGGAKALENINIDEYLKQIDQIQRTPVRLMEAESTHPLSVKRILAYKIFNQCDVLYRWRPDWKTADMKLISKEEADKKCESFISIVSSKKRI